jgi:hypothetical protein
MSARLGWPAVVRQAREIARSYDTPVTLRQLFYRLVSAQVIPNTQCTYKRLSELTAQARRQSTFPALIDRGRQVHEDLAFTSPEQALGWLARIYRLDRTDGQDVSLYLGVEKAGMVVQLRSWFGDLGIPVLALGGHSSQSYAHEVSRHALNRSRPAVLLYAGHFDPSGEGIDRDFELRTSCWRQMARVALSAEQVSIYRLPPNPDKATDSRAAGVHRPSRRAGAGRVGRAGPGRPAGALPGGHRPVLGHVRTQRDTRPGAARHPAPATAG